jgi:multimeric flavodoxin WrbA
VAIDVRKGQGPGKLDREEFRRRFQERFTHPRFDAERESLERIEAIAWEDYRESRKAPRTRAAGPEFADPAYELSLDWLATRDRLGAAALRHRDPRSPSRVILISGSSRNDATCPSEMAKSFRLVEIARATFTALGLEVDLLDLSLLSSEYGRQIHPCKGCVSTAMPLCHWPCSCYPNYSLGQSNDWMAEIYERFTLAHGVVIVTPVYWYQVPSGLKSMIDRLVCADGGNPDPTTTHGKKAEEAKAIELAGWPYPKHLAGRAYGIVVHGDVAGIEAVRRALSDWLDWMGLVSCGPFSRIDRFIGYYEPYATSHAALDRDTAVHDEVRNVARAVAERVAALRHGETPPGADLRHPRPK